MPKLELSENHPYFLGRTCNRCKAFKPTKEYDLERDKRCIGGIAMRSFCKVCDEPRKRKSDLKRHYGISIEDFETLNTKQNGKCAICSSVETNNSRTKKRLFVDHCHTTKAVRGLLCSKCNHALGLFNDDIGLLSKAILYLS